MEHTPPAPKRRPRVSGVKPPLPADIPDDSDHEFGPHPFRYRVNPDACDITRDCRPEPPPPPYAVTGLVEANGEIDIEFEPVPRLRRRRNGWTPEAQRAFIMALATCGCVSRAAKCVGMTPKSAYRLLDAPGAGSFAAAWDQAIANGIETVRYSALDRAINGSWVPVSRRGKIVRYEHRFNDRMAVALLSGRVSTVTENRERATSRRQYRQYLACREAEEAERERRQTEVDAAHQLVLDRIELERLLPRMRPNSQPRVRGL